MQYKGREGERCSTFALGKVSMNIGVSLIAGREYGTEQWNGKWNGTENVHDLRELRVLTVTS